MLQDEKLRGARPLIVKKEEIPGSSCRIYICSFIDLLGNTLISDDLLSRLMSYTGQD